MNPLIKEKLKECVDFAAPHECCGIIFGHVKEINKNGDFSYQYIGERARCLVSEINSPTSFIIENMEDLNKIILEEIQFGAKKMRLISIFHSHPSGNYPSSIDISNMKYLDQFGKGTNKFMSKAFKNLIWLIINSKNYTIKGFIYFQDNIHEVDLIIS